MASRLTLLSRIERMPYPGRRIDEGAGRVERRDSAHTLVPPLDEQRARTSRFRQGGTASASRSAPESYLPSTVVSRCPVASWLALTWLLCPLWVRRVRRPVLLEHGSDALRSQTARSVPEPPARLAAVRRHSRARGSPVPELRDSQVRWARRTSGPAATSS
jgi:hypothetical protein